MENPQEIPFQTVLTALLDPDTPLNPRYLYRLSDLADDDLSLLKDNWEQLPLWRRQALMEDLEDLGAADDLLSFEAIGRHAVSDEDPKVRELGVRVLWEFDGQDLIPIYLNLLDGDPEASVRAAAATGLGQFVYFGELDELPGERFRTIEKALLRAIDQDEEPHVQQRALESLSFASREEIPPLIEKAFESGDPDWIETALVAMGRSMDDRWNESVLEMLDHASPALRAEAARAAGEIEISSAISQLVELTKDHDEDVRAAAIWSLSQIGGDRARRTLENLLTHAFEDEDIELLESALDNLAFTEGMQAFALFEISEDEDEDEYYDQLLEDEDYLDYPEEDDEDYGELPYIEDYDEDDEDLQD